mmetsp:Transcript_24245/g.54703  ORF Transcript_24245/g.54703 Transcript_24245/m.54703 type:complete len:81 (-) Transcript_24245:1321-1563(-)
MNTTYLFVKLMHGPHSVASTLATGFPAFDCLESEVKMIRKGRVSATISDPNAMVPKWKNRPTMSPRIRGRVGPKPLGFCV